MEQKYSFVKVEGSFITCNNKIITASASASATGNTVEESDNTAYMFAKQNLELSAQQNALENNLIIKKLIKIKTVFATNINSENNDLDDAIEELYENKSDTVINELDNLRAKTFDSDIMEIEEITDEILSNKTEIEIHAEIEYILDNQPTKPKNNITICHLDENV